MNHLVESLGLVPIAIFDYLTAPLDFTFTDAVDFIFVTLIPVTLVLIAIRDSRGAQSTKWTKTASILSYALAVITPLVPLVALYLMAFRAQAVLGHWPVPMADDPKHICGGDATYQRLYNITSYVSAFAGWGLVTWAGLQVHLRNSRTAKQWIWQIAVFLAAWMLFVAEPGSRYIWWLD